MSIFPFFGFFVGCCATLAQTGGQAVRFDDFAEGTLPPGWASDMTHTGGAPRWEVIRDAAAPGGPKVLAQLSADATSARYPLAIYTSESIRDGAVRVRFRPVSGQVDQAAGIVWRFRDRDNYYLVRANALEDSVVLYKVQGGKRTALAPVGTAPGTYGIKHSVPSGVWSTLAVEFRGTRFVVLMDDTRLFEVDDTTFPGPGKVGLWTKADSVTHFNEFSVQAR